MVAITPTSCHEVRWRTGFSPEALRRHMLSAEGFWIYRAWAKAGGLM
jgi:hypothetical protein